jgi:hypothetical protein
VASSSPRCQLTEGDEAVRTEVERVQSELALYITGEGAVGTWSETGDEVVIGLPSVAYSSGTEVHCTRSGEDPHCVGDDRASEAWGWQAP